MHYRVNLEIHITVLSLISALPLISAPPFFMMVNNKELKEKLEVFRKTNTKMQKKEANFGF